MKFIEFMKSKYAEFLSSKEEEGKVEMTTEEVVEDTTEEVEASSEEVTEEVTDEVEQVEATAEEATEEVNEEEDNTVASILKDLVDKVGELEGKLALVEASSQKMVEDITKLSKQPEGKKPGERKEVKMSTSNDRELSPVVKSLIARINKK